MLPSSWCRNLRNFPRAALVGSATAANRVGQRRGPVATCQLLDDASNAKRDQIAKDTHGHENGNCKGPSQVLSDVERIPPSELKGSRTKISHVGPRSAKNVVFFYNFTLKKSRRQG